MSDTAAWGGPRAHDGRHPGALWARLSAKPVQLVDEAPEDLELLGRQALVRSATTASPEHHWVHILDDVLGLADLHLALHDLD
eukprot:5513159-Alexandrium_andersonii.AAC.1